MAQFYTLEEAAQRLNIGADEFKRKLKTEWTAIRPFRDGATLRFRAADIDELARTLGAASDPGLPLGPVGAPPAEISDEFALTGETKVKTGSDSDVRLDLASPKAAGGDGNNPTEEIALDLSGPPSSGILKPAGGSSSKLSSKSGKKLGDAKIPSASSEAGTGGPDSSSEFELSLDSDSDSFELQLTSDSSEEVDLGSLDLPPEKGTGQSGINLGKPADSGVSLEKRKGPKTGSVMPTSAQDPDSDVDFELSLDPAGASGVRLGGPKSAPRKTTAEDSSSEFELTLDDNSGVADNLAKSLQAPEEGKGDIFETDFELPVMQDESGSEVVAVESADTDLEATGFEVEVSDADAPADDDSASQVMLVDDDAPLIDEDAVLVGDEDLEAGSVGSAVRRQPLYQDGPVQTVVATPAKWGPVPAIGLALALPLVFLGVIMSFEIVQGMRGYNAASGAGGTLTRGFADALGMKVSD